LYLLPFDVQRFSKARFEAEGILCPPSIAHSVPKRQAEFFHGRMAARYALAHFGQAGATVGTGQSREPLWPEGIIGSISHNQRYAAAIALDARTHGAIGIDLETVIPAQMRDTLLATAVTPGELDYLLRLTSHLPLELLLTIVFSAKESFYKAAFPTVGRIFDFDAVALYSLDLVQRSFSFQVQEHLSAYLAPGTIHPGRYDMIEADIVCTSCNWPPFPG
jgi:4'-phosphopantetheinyl transferase EntD